MLYLYVYVRDHRNKQLNCIYPKIIFLDNLTAVAYQKSYILFGFPCFPLKLFYHSHGILNYLLILKNLFFGALRYKLKDKRIS